MSGPLNSPERHPPGLMNCGGRQSPRTEAGMHCLGSPLFYADGLSTGPSSRITSSWSWRSFRSEVGCQVRCHQFRRPRGDPGRKQEHE